MRLLSVLLKTPRGALCIIVFLWHLSKGHIINNIENVEGV